jgi:hypothetical protein
MGVRQSGGRGNGLAIQSAEFSAIKALVLLKTHQ